jgi:hypothetical protein
MLGAIGNRFRAADSAVAAYALKNQTATREAKIQKIMEQIRTGGADDTAKWIGSTFGANDHDVEDLAGRLRANAGAVAEEYGPQMPRGFFGKQKMGPMEYIHGVTAANPMVRRVGIGAAGAGGGVAMTAAGQQLLALMGFMNQETQQEQRTMQSPLV